MLLPLPQMYRKNIIQAIKCAHPLFFLLCRGEPTGTQMRDYCSDTCRPLQRTLARTAPEPCRPICVPSRVRHPKLVALSAYPRAYGSDACHPICVPSRVRFGRFHPLQRTFVLVSTHLIPLPTYVLDHLSIPTL